MYCSNCGKALHDGDRFCSFCGKPVAHLMTENIAATEEIIFNSYVPEQASEPKLKMEFNEPRQTTEPPFLKKVGDEEPAAKPLQSTEQKPSAEFVWNLHQFPKDAPKKTENLTFRWDKGEFEPVRPQTANTGSEIEARAEMKPQSEKPRNILRTERLEEKDPGQKIELVEAENPGETLKAQKTETKSAVEFQWNLGSSQPNIALNPEPINPVSRDAAESAESGSDFEEKPASELEADLFASIEEDALKAQAEKIDKFYTFNQKNEEFQKLLDKEYQKMREGRGLVAATPLAEVEEPMPEIGPETESSESKTPIDQSAQEHSRFDPASHVQEMAKVRENLLIDPDGEILNNAEIIRKFDTIELEKSLLEEVAPSSSAKLESPSEQVGPLWEGLDQPRSEATAAEESLEQAAPGIDTAAPEEKPLEPIQVIAEEALVPPPAQAAVDKSSEAQAPFIAVPFAVKGEQKPEESTSSHGETPGAAAGSSAMTEGAEPTAPTESDPIQPVIVALEVPKSPDTEQVAEAPKGSFTAQLAETRKIPAIGKSALIESSEPEKLEPPEREEPETVEPESPEAALSRTQALDQLFAKRFDEFEAAQKELAEEEVKEPKKFGPGKIVLIIIAILLVAELGILGIKYLAPESAAAAAINNKIDGFALWIKDLTAGGEEDAGGEDQPPEKPEEDEPVVSTVPQEDKSALIAGQLFNSKNIESITANPALAYSPANNYSQEGIADSKPIENNLWYTKEDGTPVFYDASVVGTLIAYDSQWIDYVNDKNQGVLDLTKKDSKAYENTAAFKDVGKITEVFKRLEIGEIRQGEAGFYIWAYEEIEVTNTGKTTEKKWIYYMEPVDGQMKIVDYYNF